MAEGWIGKVATTEWYFYVFDATPVTLAVLVLAIWHPSQYLPIKIRGPEEGHPAGADIEKNSPQETTVDGGTAYDTVRGDHDSAKGYSNNGDSKVGSPDPATGTGAASPIHDGHATLRNPSPVPDAGDFEKQQKAS